MDLRGNINVNKETWNFTPQMRYQTEALGVSFHHRKSNGEID